MNILAHYLDSDTAEIEKIVEVLHPSGIIVYGPTTEWLFKSVVENHIPIHQYDSYMMRRNRR